MKLFPTKILFGASVLIVSMATAQTETAWQNLFDGKSIENWGYVAGNWKVDSGMIIGKSKSTYNNFCHTKRKYSDFVLVARARLWETSPEYINSGIQYRSAFIDSSKHSLKGYQMDIGDGYNGSMYPEGGYPAGASGVSPSAACKAAVKMNDWNQYVITANGASIKHEMNGKLCAEYNATEKDGYLGFQLHFTTIVMEVNFKDVFIRPLNNSFPIPDSQLVYLNPDYTLKSTGIGDGFKINDSAPFSMHLNGNILTLSGVVENQNAPVSIAIMNMIGGAEYSRNYKPIQGKALILELPSLATGNHVLRITSGQKVYNSRLQLQN
jgi:hypothetical protein